MTIREPERTVRQSVLDRLIDTDPRVSGDPTTSFSESARRYKAGVMRDLEWLLNTRRIPEPVPSALGEVRDSVYLYGLPDTTSMSADDPAVRRRLQQDIRACIEHFEPRLTDVDVTLVPPPEDNKRLVRFVVEATLRMDPDEERVVFDTVLDPGSGAFRVASAHA